MACGTGIPSNPRVNDARVRAVPTPEEPAVRRAAGWPLIEFERLELLRTRWARIGWLGIVLPVALAVGAVRSEASVTDALRLIAIVVAWSTWACAGPIALAAAGASGPNSRTRGIDWLCAHRGVSLRQRQGPRALAVMFEIAWRLGLGWTLLALWLGWHERSLAVAGTAFRLLALAAVTGVFLGATAAACSALAHARGRTLFLAVLLVPWLCAGAWFGSAWSVPGLLQHAWEFVVVAPSWFGVPA